MADIPFPTNLLPQYQSPQQMALSAAQTQNLQANAGMTAAQTAGQQLTNQRSQIQLGLLQNFLGGQPGVPGSSGPAGVGSPNATGVGSSGSGADQIATTGVSPDDVSAHAFSQFAPTPTARPPSVAARIAQANMAGMPDVGQAIGAQYDAQVAGENQRRQLGANAAYQMADGVANAPAGTAWETLNRSNPAAAAAVKQRYPDDSADQLDADVRTMAQHIAASTHQYSGRDTTLENGTLIDKPSGKQVVGTNQVLTGLSATDKQKVWDDMGTTVTTADGLPTLKYKALGFPSQEAAVVAADRSARTSANTAPSANSGAPSAAATPASVRPSAAPAASAAPTGGQSPTSTDPLSKALADPAYNYTPPKVPRPTTQEQLAANTETLKTAATNYQTNVNGLKQSGDEVANASARSLQYFQAAQSLLNKPDAWWTAGLPGDVAAGLTKLGVPIQAGADRATAVKNLTQAALQGLKTTYGSKPAMFDVKVNLEQAFPDIKGSQGLQGTKDLIAENIRNLNYDLQSGRRVAPYLSAGKDPAQFNTWNEQHFQRAANVNPGSGNSGTASPTVQTASGPNGQKLYLRNGQWSAQ